MSRDLNFIQYLTKEIFKMIPLRQEEDSGGNRHLPEHISRVYIEASGAYTWSEYLSHNQKYMVVTTTLAYMSDHSLDFKIFRREALKMLTTLNKIESDLRGNTDG